MALVSSKVAAGMTILADHFNKLWTDLTANHDHSSGQGGTVDHADLAETGVMSGRTNTHTMIDAHIAAADGVHDLDNGVKIPGVLGNTQIVVFCGAKSTPGTGGTCYFSDDGASPADATFGTVIAIFLQVAGETGSTYKTKDIADYDNVTTTSFDYHIASPSTNDATALNFLVVGTAP